MTNSTGTGAGGVDVLDSDDSLESFLRRQGVSRRRFLAYCSSVAAVLALPAMPFGPQIAKALAAQPRLPVLWLNGQDCNGNIESFLRSSQPTISQLILDSLAINYVELLMAPSGVAAEKSRADTIAAGGYVAVIEGAIPTAAGGVYCCHAGRAHEDVVREVAANAIATIAVGTCAFEGGISAASGGVTGAVGVRSLLGAGATVIALPGCPMNVENLTATLVHYLTLKQWPAPDSRDRPLFAYGSEIHEHCPRLPHFEREEFVEKWGDAGHQKGWCLRHMGCQGPETRTNCPQVKWNEKTSWPVGAGSVCLGCVNADFWDVPGGFYKRRNDD